MKNVVVVGQSQIEIDCKPMNGRLIWVVEGKQYRQESVAILAAYTLAKRHHMQAQRLKETATAGLRRFSLL
jgi:hypothetical protein